MIRSDTRGVTAQIGAVLLLGLFVLMLTIYQANVVPQENRATEFDHSREVLNEMQSLQADYHNTMLSGEDVESVVTLGTEYPSRLLAVNPPSASGSLTTTPVGPISSDEIDINAVCGQDGTTRALQYEPNYRAYQNAPTITFESSVLYSDFDDKYIVESEQSIVSGNQLTLMPLNGTVSERGTGRQSVRFRAGKADTAEVTGELTLTIPTEIPADQWENDSLLLANEMVSKGGHVEAVVENATAGGIDIRLESGTTYDVACRVSGTNSVPSSGPAKGSIGGADVTANPGAGKSGESEFTGAGSTETLSSSGGLWTGVSGVNAIQVSNPRFAPTRAGDGTISQQNRYFRLGITISNDTTKYALLVGKDEAGIAYKQTSTYESWQELTVIVYKTEEGSTPTKLFEKPLTKAAVEHWLDDGSLELLDRLSYNAQDSAIESELTEMRALLNDSDDTDMFITNMHGRADAQLVEDNGTDAPALYVNDQNSDTIAVKPDGDSHYDAIRFELGGHPIKNIDEITNVSLNIIAGPTAQRIENSRGGTGSYNRHVYFQGNSQNGYIDRDFDTGSTTEFDQKTDIQSGGSVQFYINGFIDSAGDEVDLAVGDKIEVTLEYVIEGVTYEQTLSMKIDRRVNNN